MHEIGLLRNALSCVKQMAFQKGLHKVQRVNLVVGVMQGISNESLKHALEVIAADDDVFKGCEVCIREINISLRCLDCCNVFSLEIPISSCPSCASVNLNIISGREFYVESFQAV